MCPVLGVDAGQRPFLLNKSNKSFQSDKKVCLSIGVYAGHAWKITVKSHRSAEVAVNNKKCPACGCEMKRTGARGPARSALALPCVQDELDPRQRLRRQGPPILRRMKHCRRKPSSICRVRAGPSGARRRGSGGSGPCRGRRRDSSRGVRRRHLDRPRPGRSHRMLRLRPVLAPSRRAETTSAWRSLLSRIAPPDMVVTDGGSGSPRQRRRWPATSFKDALSTRFAR